MLSSNVDYAALIYESTALVKGLLQEFAGLSDVFGQLAIANTIAPRVKFGLDIECDGMWRSSA